MWWKELGLERNMDSQRERFWCEPKIGSARALGRQEGESLEEVPTCRLIILGWV